MTGTLRIEGDIWLTTKDDRDEQQLNPALISTIVECGEFDGDTYTNR